MPRRAHYGPEEERPCNDCKEVKSASEYYVKLRNEDGTVRVRSNLCKDCKRRRDQIKEGRTPRTPPRKWTKGELRRKRRLYYLRVRRDPERLERLRARKREEARRRTERAKRDTETAKAIRESRRRYYAKIMADPERYAIKLENQRIDYRLRESAARAYPNAIGAYCNARDLVPAGPFRACLETLFPDMTPEQIERETGIRARTIRNLATQPSVSITLVDEALTRGLGRPDLVAALYPVE